MVAMNSKKFNVVLASSSRTRRTLLKEIPEVENVIVKGQSFDEEAFVRAHPEYSPELLVLALSQKKNETMSKEDFQYLEDSNVESWFLLTGDQIVMLNKCILMKPSSPSEVYKTYEEFWNHGKPPLIHTVQAISVRNIGTGLQMSNFAYGSVRLNRKISQKECDNFMACAMKSAGGLLIDHPSTKSCFDLVQGTEDVILGLSKEVVVKLLDSISQLK